MLIDCYLEIPLIHLPHLSPCLCLQSISRSMRWVSRKPFDGPLYELRAYPTSKGSIRIGSLCRFPFSLSQNFFQYLDGSADAEQGLADMIGLRLQFFKPFLAFLEFGLQFCQAGMQLLFHFFPLLLYCNMTRTGILPLSLASGPRALPMMAPVIQACSLFVFGN